MKKKLLAVSGMSLHRSSSSLPDHKLVDFLMQQMTFGAVAAATACNSSAAGRRGHGRRYDLSILRRPVATCLLL